MNLTIRSYRALGRSPGALGITIAAGIGRVHLGGLGLATLLVAREATGSIAAAGFTAGAMSLGAAVTRPLQGRVMDRNGVRPVLLGLLAAHVVAVAALVLAAGGGLTTAPLAVLATAVGFTVPTLSVAIRAMWTQRFPDPSLRAAAFSSDIATENAAFMLGPLLAGAVAAASSPGAALVALCLVGFGGTAYIAAVARPVPPRTALRERAPGLARGLGPLAGASFALGIGYGAVDVAAAARALEHGNEAAAGALVASLFAGGALGALLLGVRGSDTAPRTRLRRRLGAFCLLAAALPLVPGIPALGVALFCAGTALGPALIALLLTVADDVPAERRAEAFGWAGAALRIGTAAGTAITGVVVEQASTAAGFLVVAPAALAALVIVRRDARRWGRGAHAS